MARLELRGSVGGSHHEHGVIVVRSGPPTGVFTSGPPDGSASAVLVSGLEFLLFPIVGALIATRKNPSRTGYGTGLEGIADRLAALGGSLEVVSAPGDGTTVAGRIPVAGGISA